MAVRIQDGSSEASFAAVSSAVSSAFASSMSEINEDDGRVKGAKQSLFELAVVLDNFAHVFESFSACIVRPAKEMAQTGRLDAFEAALVRHAPEEDHENMKQHFRKFIRGSEEISYGQITRMFSTTEEIAVSSNRLYQALTNSLATALYRSIQRSHHVDPNAEPADPSSTLGSTSVAETVGRLRQQLRDQELMKVLRELVPKIHTPFLLEEVEKIFPFITPAMAYLGKFITDAQHNDRKTLFDGIAWNEILHLFGFSVLGPRRQNFCYKDFKVRDATLDLEHIEILPTQTLARFPLLMDQFKKLFTYEETKSYTVKLDPLVQSITAWVNAFNGDATKRAEIEMRGDMNSLINLIIEKTCPLCPTECSVVRATHNSDQAESQQEEPQIKHCNKCAKTRAQCLSAQAMFTVYQTVIHEKDKCLMAVVDGVTDTHISQQKEKRKSLGRLLGIGSDTGSEVPNKLTMFILNGYLIIAEPSHESGKWTLQAFYNILSGGNLAVTVSSVSSNDWNLEISVIGQKDPIASFFIPQTSVRHLQRQFVPMITAITAATVQTSLDTCVSNLFMAGSTDVLSFTTAVRDNGGKQIRPRWTVGQEPTMLGICEAFIVDYSADPLRLPVDWCMDVAGPRGYLCNMFKCVAAKKQEAISVIMGGSDSLLSSQLVDSAWQSIQKRIARESIQPRPAQVCDKVKAIQKLISAFEAESDFGSVKRCSACIWAVQNGYTTARTTDEVTEQAAVHTFCNGLRLDGETSKSSCTKFIADEVVASRSTDSVVVESASDPVQVCKSRGFCSSSCSSRPKSTKLTVLRERN
eukprot:GILJ01001137.1.p1 GENE.GILJ01001137.1~~GILJ01001137.1.p1  ORF type:complete len:848 (+),score=142.78 GILJ01001137.1:121-2544(+)